MGDMDTSQREVDIRSSVLSGRDRYDRLPEATFDAVAQQLVQRLQQRLRGSSDRSVVAPGPTDRELTTFCDALIAPDRDDSRQIFDDLRVRGVTPDTLSLRYFAAAAQRLGEYWSADSCGFLEVTLGCARLHALQRSLRGDFIPSLPNPPGGLTALFAPIPDDSHVLGIRIAADFFRRAGWHVEFQQPRDLDELSALAAVGDFNLIGISAGCMSVLPQLHAAVARLRTIKPDAVLVLGGHIIELEPQISQQLDIDHTVTDVTTAPLILQRHVCTKTNH